MTRTALLERLIRDTRIGNQASQKARDEIRRAGLPLVFSHRGRLYYELPDGTITDKEPEMFKKKS